MNNRTFLVKVMSVGVLSLAFVSHHAWSENSVIDLLFEMTGVVLLCIGAFGRAWASGFISGKKNRTLITDGPYSIVRNPLYLFSFIGFLGAGLAFESVVILALFVLIFFLTHWPTILQEEEKLRDLFGTDYSEYANRVPRFIPGSLDKELPETASFSSPIFTKAVFESMLIVLIFPIAQAVEWGQVHAVLPVYFNLY